MACCGFGTLVLSMLLLFAALSLTVVAAITNYWFWSETRDLVSEEQERAGNYNFGFWFKCYDDVPRSIPSDDLSGKCEKIFDDLMPPNDDNVTSDQQLVVDLSRSYIGLSLASGIGMLATLLTLLCGSVPGDCRRMKKQGLYCGSAVLALFSVLASMGSGVCFIAAREVESSDLDLYSGLDTRYGLSFMLHWGSTGLCVIANFVLVGLARHRPDDVKSAKNYYYNM